jgi:GNAT superfamily N-acetyltransferase
MSIPDTLITTYLQMESLAEFVPAFIETDAQILPLTTPDVTYYRFLYRTVGEAWRWRDRLTLDDATLHAALARDAVSIDVLYVAGAPAGYIELERAGSAVEIAYFGLRDRYFGQGLGKHLLSHGIRRAWDGEGIQRVWVHTCNLDGPYALANYQRRGFTVYDVQRDPMPARYR